MKSGGTQSIVFNARSDHRESAENYRRELCRHGDFRVAECRDGIQWFLQRRRGRISAGGAAWDSFAYCATQKALSRLYQKHTGVTSEVIDFLPSHISRSKKK